MKSLKGFSFIIPIFKEISIASHNSFSDPITFVSFPSELLQIGNGIPQNLDRERFQSFALLSQFPNLPSPVAFGFQFISLFRAVMFSLTSLILMNQESRG